jgi:hypothetical protein
MNFKEIKGVKHFVYSLTEWEIKHPLSKLESWRVGLEGDWVLTDDEHIVQILKKIEYNKISIVRCVTGTYDINGSELMMSDIPENIYSFSKKDKYKTVKNRKKVNTKEFLFAQYVARGVDITDSYIKAFDTDNKDYAKLKAQQLMRTERIKKVVSKEIRDILDSEGVTPNYIIQVFKQVTDLADKDGDRLRALESLAKISGLFETEKKSEQLTVFAGFTDEQLKAINDGQSKKLAKATKKS